MQQYFAKEKIDDNTFLLNSEDLNHIKNVMRMKENDEIIVAYEDKSYICSLKNVLKANIKTIFKEEKTCKNFICYIPLLSEDKMSFVLKYGTQLGFTKFIIVQYSHCKYKLKKVDYEKKLTRWNKIVKEASEQCYRIHKPIIEDILDVDNVVDGSNVKILCSLDNNDVKPINEVLTSNNCNDTISIAFGPEGGLNTKEEDILVNKGFTKTSLGKNILRCETVPIYIASIKSYLNGSE